ncbi:MAG: DUF1206 domain-containing protein [Nocardioidaceae bacterium]
MGVSTSINDFGRRADSSDALDTGVRIGLAVYGVVHLIIAWTAVQLAFSGSGGNASQQGALSQMAKNPLGQATMWIAAVGFLALVLWQAAEALVGHRSQDGGARAFKRVASGVKVLVYGALGLCALRLALGSGSSGGGGTQTMTARLMRLPAGPLIVGLVGLSVIGVAGYLAYRGWAEKFTKRLDVRAKVGERRKPIVLFGKIGYISKGVALGIVGLLFVYAAMTHDPHKSGGLDQALHKLLQQPYGAPMLVAVALGIGCYGCYCFAWARHLDR